MELCFEQQRFLSISRPSLVCCPLVKNEYTKHSKIRRYNLYSQRGASGTSQSKFTRGERSSRIGSERYRFFGGRFTRLQNGREQFKQMQFPRCKPIRGISLESKPQEVRPNKSHLDRDRLRMVQFRRLHTSSSSDPTNPLAATCAIKRGHY